MLMSVELLLVHLISKDQEKNTSWHLKKFLETFRMIRNNSFMQMLELKLLTNIHLHSSKWDLKWCQGHSNRGKAKLNNGAKHNLLRKAISMEVMEYLINMTNMAPPFTLIKIRINMLEQCQQEEEQW